MIRTDAIILLMWCVPLAAKLGVQGNNSELTKDDWVTLKGFSRVWEGGWLGEAEVRDSAGLSQSDIEMLTSKMLKELAKSKKWRKIGSVNDSLAGIQPPSHGENKVTILEVLEITEAKELFIAGRFNEALPKLYRLAATYPDDSEIRDLIIQSLRAQRQPTKMIVKVENHEIPEVKSSWISIWNFLRLTDGGAIFGKHSPAL